MDPRRDRTDTFLRGLVAGALVGAVIAGSSAWGRHRAGMRAGEAVPAPGADGATPDPARGAEPGGRLVRQAGEPPA